MFVPAAPAMPLDDDIHARYETLVNLRETQPERAAAAATSALQKSRKSSEALIAALRAEIDAYKENKQLGCTASMPSDELTAARAESADLRRQLADARAKLAATSQSGVAAAVAPSSQPLEARLAFYEMATGMRVEMDGDVARCVVSIEPASEDAEDEVVIRGAKPKRNTVAFDLSLAPAEGEEGEVEYIPTDLSECSAPLPEYLRDSLTFERSQMPAFLQKLLSGLANEKSADP
jgi:hypothetical protein